jgi:predicted transcriptional regulator
MAGTRTGRPRLGELEVAVLEEIWRDGPADVKQVHARLGHRRSVVHNTVQSTMDRLFKKGYLDREKVSHAFVYSARMSRKEVLERAVGEVLERLGGDRPSSALSAFVDLTAREGEDSLRELERLVADRLALASEAEG